MRWISRVVTLTAGHPPASTGLHSSSTCTAWAQAEAGAGGALGRSPLRSGRPLTPRGSLWAYAWILALRFTRWAPGSAPTCAAHRIKNDTGPKAMQMRGWLPGVDVRQLMPDRLSYPRAQGSGSQFSGSPPETGPAVMDHATDGTMDRGTYRRAVMPPSLPVRRWLTPLHRRG